MPLNTGVNSYHPSYAAVRSDYIKMSDVLTGERAIKKKTTTYLPALDAAMVQPIDHNDAAALLKRQNDQTRYSRYLERAQFISFTARICHALAGLGFLRDPEVSVPNELRALGFEENCTGTGVSLIQFAKHLVYEVLAYGRAGIWVDQGVRTEDIVTVADEQEANLVPYFVSAKAQDIVNWYSSEKMVRLVVLKQQVETLDKFTVELADRWRVLRLDNSGYVVEIYTDGTADDASKAEGTFAPEKSNGERFNYIPFRVCNAGSNEFNAVDTPPLMPVGNLNIGHYRNSADVEWSSFLAGMPILAITGLNNPKLDAIIKAGGKVQTGSQSVLFLGEGGDAKMVQAAPNALPRELAIEKIQNMQMLGIELATNTGQVKTATQSLQESISRNSVLVSALKNVSECIADAMRDACQFTGDDPDSVVFELDTSFEDTEAQDAVAQAVAAPSDNNVEE